MTIDDNDSTSTNYSSNSLAQKVENYFANLKPEEFEETLKACNFEYWNKNGNNFISPDDYEKMVKEAEDGYNSAMETAGF